MLVSDIRRFGQCVSAAEKRQRFGVTVTNLFIWIVILAVTVASFGTLLILVAFGWILKYIVSEYNVRKLQALGATVSPEQFPGVYDAVSSVCQRFNVRKNIRVVILESGETNAFAMRFARKHVVLILTELLEGLVDKPEQLRALAAHELCHVVLDHGWRGHFEIYKPARYRAARELTCDNAGYVAAGDIEAAKTMIKKLCVGKYLYARLSEQALVAEAKQINRGLVGWFVRQYLTHPSAGTRLENLEEFVRRTSPRLR